MSSTQRTLICILCPRTCRLKVEHRGTEILRLQGHHCTRGYYHALEELRDPRRRLRGEIAIKGIAERLPVHTSGRLPRSLHPQVQALMAQLTINLPIAPGQLIAIDLLGSGIDLVATRGQT